MMHALLVDHAMLPEVLAVPGLLDEWRAMALQRLPDDDAA
jgi:hypothetical protein